MKYGVYCTAIIGDPLRGEWTNVGIILFDEEGNQFGAKMDNVERAIRRGDLTSRCGWDTRLSDFPKQFPTLTSIDKFQQSTGFVMSRLRIIRSGAIALSATALDELYTSIVAQ